MKREPMKMLDVHWCHSCRRYRREVVRHRHHAICAACIKPDSIDAGILDVLRGNVTKPISLRQFRYYERGTLKGEP